MYSGLVDSCWSWGAARWRYGEGRGGGQQQQLPACLPMLTCANVAVAMPRDSCAHLCGPSQPAGRQCAMHCREWVPSRQRWCARWWHALTIYAACSGRGCPNGRTFTLDVPYLMGNYTCIMAACAPIAPSALAGAERRLRHWHRDHSLRVLYCPLPPVCQSQRSAATACASAEPERRLHQTPITHTATECEDRPRHASGQRALIPSVPLAMLLLATRMTRLLGDD